MEIKGVMAAKSDSGGEELSSDAIMEVNRAYDDSDRLYEMVVTLRSINDGV
jgi:hypothetical protein